MIPKRGDCNHSPFRWKHIKPQKTYRTQHSSHHKYHPIWQSHPKRRNNTNCTSIRTNWHASNCGPRSSATNLSGSGRAGWTYGGGLYQPPKEKLGSYYSISWLSAKRIFEEYGDPNAVTSPLQPQHHQDTNDSDSEEGPEVFNSSDAIIDYLDQTVCPTTPLLRLRYTTSESDYSPSTRPRTDGDAHDYGTNCWK